jgi:hypothetical protein
MLSQCGCPWYHHQLSDRVQPTKQQSWSHDPIPKRNPARKQGYPKKKRKKQLVEDLREGINGQQPETHNPRPTPDSLRSTFEECPITRTCTD